MSAQFCAISAKLKAMNRSTLKRGDYEEMLLKKTVPEICDYLVRNTRYSDNLKNLAREDIHRRRMEEMIWQEQFSDYMSLYQFISSEQRTLLKYLFLRREIDYLKSRIRSMYTGDEQTPVFRGAFKEFFRRHSRINREAVHEAKTLAEYRDACKDTPMYAVLARAEELDADYFAVSMMLDSFYFQELWKEKKRFFRSGGEDEGFTRLIGEEIDCLNIIWMYRAKKYFKMSPELIYTYLIPVRYRLSPEQIRIMADAEDADKMIAAVRITPYAALFDNIGEEGVFVEENYRRLRARTAERIFVNEPRSMGEVFAYFQIKEAETYRIITIIEGKRYSVEDAIIRQHLMFA